MLNFFGKKYLQHAVKILVIILYTNKKHQIYRLQKLNRRELYNIQSILKEERFSFQKFCKILFQNYDLAWKIIYTLPRRVTVDTKFRIFFRMLNAFSPLCSFSMKEPQSSIHLFILIQKRISLVSATIVSPRFTNNSINYATGRHLRFYRS